jgi:hypothetical protein
MKDALLDFVAYVRTLQGDEKGEAQVFCDRLFRAFGHGGYKEAGATLEFRVKAKGKSTRYADLLWRPRLLLEMKKRGENLEKHYQQVFEYWLELVPNRPKYVILCNFDEFWIYDFDSQLREPVDRIGLDELIDRYTALNFLFPENRPPLFQNDRVNVTREAADRVARVFQSLRDRGENAEIAQRFTLQCVMALFAEDIDLLPRGLFSEILTHCRAGASAYDLIGGLFRQMGDPRPAPKNSRYHNVRYFNGGIFSIVRPIALNPDEIALLLSASQERWSKVEPAIFGTLFESSMDREERHAFGAHYTSEADIQKVILPTIIRPWRERIESARTLKELLSLRQELIAFTVLDPACGSGNFLYVAYREMKRLEAELLRKIHDNFSDRATAAIGTLSLIKTTQFYGMDIKSFAVELAKVTLMLAKKLALDEENELLGEAQLNLPLEFDQALPLDNLDNNIRVRDALFEPWKPATAIIGNPPFLGAKHIRLVLGDDYIDRVFDRFSGLKDVDFCAYWFRLAHENLGENCRAGLVATNSISQGKSRKATLDHIINNGGFIHDAISTQPWSGEAKVHVSIVNWQKGERQENITYRLDHRVVDRINSSLKSELDVTKAYRLSENLNLCFQGVIPNGKGFIVTEKQVRDWIETDLKNQEVLKLFSMGKNLAKNPHGKPDRWIIDFDLMTLEQASEYRLPFERLRSTIPKERANNRNQKLKDYWWQYEGKRIEMRKSLAHLSYCFAVPRVSKWAIFIPLPNKWLAGDKSVIVASDDFYILGILTSSLHRIWMHAQKSTLKADIAYTHNTCFETFPFPPRCSEKQKEAIRQATLQLHEYRTEQMEKRQWGITDLYNEFFDEPASQLAKLHRQIDTLVFEAYEIESDRDPLTFLLELNAILAGKT